MTRDEQIKNWIKEYEELTGEELSYEEAEQDLIQQGQISDVSNGQGSWAFVIDGVQELKSASLFGTSRLLAYNMAVKKDKKAVQFIEGDFYLGSDVKKDEAGNIDIENSTIGTPLGDTVDIIVLGTSIYAKRFNARQVIESNKKKGLETPPNVSSTFATDMFEKGQKEMIDYHSGKSIFELRNELFSKYGGKQNAQMIPKEEKINFHHYIYGLVKTDDGLKPFWMDMKPNMAEDALPNVIAKAPKEGIALRSVFITLSNVYKGDRFIKVAEVGEKVGDEFYEEVRQAVIDLGKKFKDIKARQAESISNKDYKGSKTQSKGDKSSNNDDPFSEDEDDDNPFAD